MSAVTESEVRGMLSTLLGIVEKFVPSGEKWYEGGKSWNVSTIVSAAGVMLGSEIAIDGSGSDEVYGKISDVIEDGDGSITFTKDRGVCIIELCSKWTDFTSKTFSGESFEVALSNVVAKKEEVDYRTSMLNTPQQKTRAEEEYDASSEIQEVIIDNAVIDEADAAEEVAMMRIEEDVDDGEIDTEAETENSEPDADDFSDLVSSDEVFCDHKRMFAPIDDGGGEAIRANQKGR